MTQREKKTDKYSRRSEQSLGAFIERRVKNVYKTALKCIEMKFGDDFEGYKAIRAEILRAGNDGIRQVKEALEQNFNVEELPEVIVVDGSKKERE